MRANSEARGGTSRGRKGRVEDELVAAAELKFLNFQLEKEGPDERRIEDPDDGAKRVVQRAELVLLLALPGAGGMPDIVRKRALLGGKQGEDEKQDPQHGAMLLRMMKVFFLFILFAGQAYGQTEEVVTVALQSGTIAGLVAHQEGAKGFKHGVALFPGHPGIMKLRREDDGQAQYELRGNYLVRSRRHWLDNDTLVAVIDAPSDEWASFTQHYRSTPPYGEAIKALVGEIGRRYAIDDWTFVGTSEGSISAFHAARMNPQLARRVILTSSVFKPGRNGPGLAGVDWKALKGALLFVHHADDPCEYTTYRDAQRAAEAAGAPLVTVRGGGPAKGGACQAFTAHGFVGVERPVVLAMRSWIKSAAVPPDVAP
jgi:hypothetical protein